MGGGESLLVRDKLVLDFSGEYSKEITPGIIRNYTKRSIDKRKLHEDNENEFKETIVELYKEKGIKLEKGNVCSMPSLKESFFNIMGCFLKKEDYIVLLEPNTINEDIFNLGGVNVIKIELNEENGYVPDINDINEPEKIKMFFISVPHNPTGTVFPEVIMKHIIEFCIKNEIILVVDEVNLEFYFEKEIESSLKLSKEILVLNSPVNRSFMENYGLSFLAGREDLIKNMEEFNKSFGIKVSSFMKDAAIAAYSDERHVKIMRENYKIKKNTISNALNERGFEVLSKAGPYLWIRKVKNLVSELSKEGIKVEEFGDYVRISLFPEIKDCKKLAEVIRRL